MNTEVRKEEQSLDYSRRVFEFNISWVVGPKDVLAFIALIFLPLAVLSSSFSSHASQSAVWAGLAISFLATCVIVLTERLHGHVSIDSGPGVQKVHAIDVPRIGGLALFAAFLVAASMLDWEQEVFGTGPQFSALWVLLCALPILGAGLIEDFTKTVSVRTRLLASVASGLLGCWLMGATLPRLGVPGLDYLLQFAWFAVPLTAFAVAGVINSINIVDGFNGLATGIVSVIAMGLSLIAFTFDDYALMNFSMVIAAISVGFMAVNYFTGRIFLGDGGAYFLGFLLSQVAVLMVVRHPEMSPWLVLVAFAYPVTEVITSIVRRMRMKLDAGQPDRDHLHHRIQNCLVFASKTPIVQVNSSVSKFVWCLVWVTLTIASIGLTTPSSIHLLLFVLSVGVYLLTFVKCKSFADRENAQVQ